ncbi:hypothetical protein [Paenibacillus medicaginis]|uniref:Uncharacterized protein n=1 Tax=Paenibacillus medicaginis TaxID=1470560 RepID=A0ABV5C2G4_9BACL
MLRQIRMLAVFLLFITLCIPQQLSADSGPGGVDRETEKRLMLQYGLDKPQEISKIEQFVRFWSQSDFGYSFHAEGMYDTANLVLYPLPWVCSQLPAIVYIIKMPFIQP